VGNTINQTKSLKACELSFDLFADPEDGIDIPTQEWQ
jgi:hypothetical protein